MPNVADNDSLNGRRIVFRPDDPKPYPAPDYNVGGTLVCQPGDHGTIIQGYNNWNGVEGLTIYYVQFDRGTNSHFSEREITILPE